MVRSVGSYEEHRRGGTEFVRFDSGGGEWEIPAVRFKDYVKILRDSGRIPVGAGIRTRYRVDGKLPSVKEVVVERVSPTQTRTSTVTKAEKAEFGVGLRTRSKDELVSAKAGQADRKFITPAQLEANLRKEWADKFGYKDTFTVGGKRVSGEEFFTRRNRAEYQNFLKRRGEYDYYLSQLKRAEQRASRTANQRVRFKDDLPPSVRAGGLLKLKQTRLFPVEAGRDTVRGRFFSDVSKSQEEVVSGTERAVRAGFDRARFEFFGVPIPIPKKVLPKETAARVAGGFVGFGFDILKFPADPRSSVKELKSGLKEGVGKPVREVLQPISTRSQRLGAGRSLLGTGAVFGATALVGAGVVKGFGVVRAKSARITGVDTLVRAREVPARKGSIRVGSDVELKARGVREFDIVAPSKVRYRFWGGFGKERTIIPVARGRAKLAPVEGAKRVYTKYLDSQPMFGGSRDILLRSKPKVSKVVVEQPFDAPKIAPNGSSRLVPVDYFGVGRFGVRTGGRVRSISEVRSAVKKDVKVPIRRLDFFDLPPLRSSRYDLLLRQKRVVKPVGFVQPKNVDVSFGVGRSVGVGRRLAPIQVQDILTFDAPLPRGRSQRYQYVQAGAKIKDVDRLFFTKGAFKVGKRSYPTRSITLVQDLPMSSSFDVFSGRGSRVKVKQKVRKSPVDLDNLFRLSEQSVGVARADIADTPSFSPRVRVAAGASKSRVVKPSSYEGLGLYERMGGFSDILGFGQGVPVVASRSRVVRSDSFVAPISIFGGLRQDSLSRQKTLLRQRQVVKQQQEVSQVVRGRVFQSPILAIKPLTAQDFKTRQKLSVKQQLRQRQVVKQQQKVSFGFPIPTSPKVPSVPFGFGFVKPTPSVGRGKGLGDSSFFGYQAGFTSLTFGITSPKVPVDRIYTGLETRPVIVSKKKRRKK